MAKIFGVAPHKKLRSAKDYVLRSAGQNRRFLFPAASRIHLWDMVSRLGFDVLY